MALRMSPVKQNGKWLLAALGLAVLALLVWAWRDAGVEPVRPLSAPATLPPATLPGATR